MATIRWALVGLAALAAAGAWVHYSGAGARPERAEVQFHCPMHPSVVADSRGSCPICGMDLVPISSGREPAPRAAAQSAAGAAGVPGRAPIDLTPERRQLIGMRTARAVRDKLSPTLRTVGFVTADEGRITLVTTRFAGWVEELLVSQSGEHVDRGEPLARVYSPDLVGAQQAFVNALRWVDEKQGTSPSGPSTSPDRDARNRLQLAGVPDADIEEVARTRKPLRNLTVRSPLSGYVGRKAAVAGLYVQPGTELFEIADLSSVWVIADVYESEMSRVRVGQKATIHVSALPGESHAGRVSFLYPAVSTGSRTLQVRLEIKNPGMKLRPGMFADVTLELGAGEALVVPAEAVVDTGELQYLFVVRPGGRLEPRRLRLGSRAGGMVEVLEGVAEGETVVTTANFLVDSESRLRAAIEGFSGAGGAAPQSAPEAAERENGR